MKRLIIALVSLVALSGCATKHYGRMGELTDYERQTLTCREIDLEEAKVYGFLDQVNKESSFDGRSVLSFLGDFGIGNVMEKDNAVDSANTRLRELQELRLGRNCTSAAPVPPQKEKEIPAASGPQNKQPNTTSDKTSK